MQVPIQVSYRNVEKTEGVQTLLEEQARKLERICDYITSCRVAVERMNEHQQTGSPYRVRVEIHVPPGHSLVVNHEPGEGKLHDDLPKVIRETFGAVKRQLKRLVEEQRGDVKLHEEQEAMALVVRLFPEQGYGFIQTIDGREIYFHRNAVLANDFDRLEIGTSVRFVEEEGEKGPQASTVGIVDKPGARLPLTGGDQQDVPLGW